MELSVITYTRNDEGVDVDIDFQNNALNSLDAERREYFKNHEEQYEHYICLYHKYCEDYDNLISFKVFEPQIKCLTDEIDLVLDCYCNNNREWFQRYFDKEAWINDLVYVDGYTAIWCRNMDCEWDMLDVEYAWIVDMNNLERE